MQGLNLINEFGEMCALRAFRINHEAPRSRAIPTFAKWVPEIRENGYDFLNNICSIFIYFGFGLVLLKILLTMRMPIKNLTRGIWGKYARYPDLRVRSRYLD